MRKRHIYTQGDRATSKLPTIIIMCIVLFCILYFGKSMSESVARIFVDEEPAVDSRAAQAPAEPGIDAVGGESSESAHPTVTDSPGKIIYNANKSAAQATLERLADHP